MNNEQQSFLLSLVVPVYFEEECIAQFISEATTELEKHQLNYEIVFVDDGSEDQTVSIIQEHIKQNSRIRLIEFSYNHGKASAVTAAITYAKGDYILYMDPDLQDPPDEIIRFVNKIQEGYDLVFGTRQEKKDTFINRMMSSIFWLTLDSLTGLNLPRPLAVMRIFSRRFADEFLKYGEANRFIEGLFMQVGMNWTQIEIPQRERFAGKSKFNFRRKMELAFNAIFDYSDLPLKLATRFGAVLVAASVFFGTSLFIARFFMEFKLGWPSLFLMLMFGFGTNIFFMGLIGKYIGNIYKETKQRPLFSVKEFYNIQEKA